ncbi:MAG: signal peptide peptidase SppA [Spirochaetaceae bacterium]|nr:signal peptide peptidase SppA [Spirochaetaceae bacterium]
MSKKIAKIIIEGTIEKENDSYKQEWVLSTIKMLKTKKDIAGIIVYINSPGGGVYESDEVYEALLQYKEETKKPVYAYFASLAASGGYYIGCAADKIIANRNTITGSIGVIAGRFMDLTELMAKYGIKSKTIHAGKNKIMGSFDEPATEEQKQIMQSIADECYEQFTQIVAKSRNMELEKVYTLADGRIYTALQAKNCGLVDEIAHFEKAVEIFKVDIFNDKDYEIDIKEFKNKPKKNLVKMLKDASTFMGNKGLFSELTPFIEKKSLPFPAYYCDLGSTFF